VRHITAAETHTVTRYTKFELRRITKSAIKIIAGIPGVPAKAAMRDSRIAPQTLPKLRAFELATAMARNPNNHGKLPYRVIVTKWVACQAFGWKKNRALQKAMSDK
jgi:hypothetical protein